MIVDKWKLRMFKIWNPNNIFNVAMDLPGVGGRTESHYYVQVYTDSSAQTWQMVIHNQAAQAQSGKYSGLLAQSKANYYTIAPVTKIERGMERLPTRLQVRWD